ncbi:MAG TPA: ATP-binding protein [Azospirillum sp.]|nr:ATP-binding protein [Azospirillum sp.]
MAPHVSSWTSRGWPLQALFGLSVILPVSLFAWTAWSSRVQELRDAERTAVRTVSALHEHIVKVLDTHEVVLAEINRRIEGRSWDDIENDTRLREDLARIEANIGQIQAISLIDGEGRPRVTTLPSRLPGLTVADRDYFTAQRERDAGTYISAPFTGRATQQRSVGVSRRRTAPDGRFDGIVLLSVPVSYITAFWEQFAPTIAHVIPLVRADGQVIARHPASNTPEKLKTDGPFLSRALKEPKGVYTAVSQVDGIERLNAYSRVKDYPLFISFSIEARAVLERWYRSVALYGVYTLLAVVAFVGMTVMAIRQYRAQEEAAWRWQEQADRLAAEIAARETVEASLHQSQKMEVVGQITGGLAHDFNNLLQAMTSGLYVLSTKVPEDARPIADATMQAVERGSKLVRQLMAFSRRQQLEPQPVDVRDLVAGMGDLLQKAVGDGVRIEVEIERGVDPIMVDPTQTELAVLNLAINARDAMDGKGRITIAARNVTVLRGEDGKLQSGDYVVLAVSDTGCGMTPEIIEHAFDPFFTTKELGKGTGLGLSMVHGFANQSGGGAEIDSKPGEGTTISLYLPKAEAQPRRGRPPCAAAAPGGGGTILLVEDEALARMGIAMALRELGYEVVEARSGEDAMEALDTMASLDLLITDYAMPGMTGLELTATIRHSHPDLKAILITGNAAFSFDEATSGVSAIVRKPFRVEDLAERIRTFLAPEEPTPKASGQNVIAIGTRSGNAR